MVINEMEEHDRYEAWTTVGGVKFSKVVWRSAYGWPPGYKETAHAEIKNAIHRHDQAKTRGNTQL